MVLTSLVFDRLEAELESVEVLDELCFWRLAGLVLVPQATDPVRSLSAPEHLFEERLHRDLGEVCRRRKYQGQTDRRHAAAALSTRRDAPPRACASPSC